MEACPVCNPEARAGSKSASPCIPPATAPDAQSERESLIA